MQPRLLVPVHVDALVINNNTSRWKNLRLDIDSLSAKRYEHSRGLSDALEPPISTSAGNSFYPDGIHLHWVLPASFRHGVHREGADALEFPLVPNRWLVVRADKQQLLRAWVIESDTELVKDAPGQLGESNWIRQTYDAAGKQHIEPVRIGKLFRLEDWSEQKTDPLFLTATAPGNPDFGASDMHSKGVFGFHDDMQGVEAGSQFSYKVYGWFSDSSANPFAGIATKAGFLEKLDALSWSLTNTDILADGTCPDDIVCHGAVNSVIWSAMISAQVPAPGNIRLGIGNSSTEALAALLRDHISGGLLHEPEKLLAAYQYQLLKDNGIHDDSLSLLKKQLHAGGFSPLSGGTRWVVEKEEKDAPPENASKAEAPAAPPFNSGVSKLLDSLNKSQRQYDALVNDLKAARAQLYALAYKKQYADTSGAPLSNLSDDEQDAIVSGINTDIDSLENRIRDKIARIKGLKQPLDVSQKSGAEWPAGWTGAIVSGYIKLSAALTDSRSNMPGYTIKEVPDAVFYQPVDPAVVIDGLRPSEKYLNKGNIRCRTTDQVAEALHGDNFNMAASDLAESSGGDIFAAVMAGKVPAEINALLAESLLLDPLNTAAMADFIDRREGNTRTPAQRDELSNQIAGAIAGLDTANAASALLKSSGSPAVLPESYAIQSWTQPWIPVYMEWGVDWFGTDDTFPDDKPINSWSFGTDGNNIDYLPQTEAILPNANNPGKLYGRTILSDSLTGKLAELKKSKDGLFQDMQPMSQTLGGLHSQLLLRYPGVQLPVLSSANTPDAALMELIGDEYIWRPMMDQHFFQPLRGGFFRLSMLRVIDAFGQVLEIYPAKDKNDGQTGTSTGKSSFPGNVSSGMTVTTNTSGSDYLAFAPRIIPPSRLRFDWLSAGYPDRITDSDPGTSPVCGWLLHNRMDASIAVFDAAGVEIGELRKRDGAVRFELYDAPAPQTNNSRLDGIVRFAQTSTGVFDELMAQIDAVNRKAEAKASRQSLSMLLPVGFPIAVVGAQYALELKAADPRAANQYWLPGSASQDFTGVTYDLCIGNAASGRDGLLGYFVADDFSTLKLAFGGKSNEVHFTQDFNAPLRIGTTVALTLLLDPRLTLNLSSGILPAVDQELPPHTIAAPLKAINLRFLSAPVISPASSNKIPLMQSEDARWSWISWQGKGAAKAITETTPDTNIKTALKFEPLRAMEGWLKVNTRPADSSDDI